MYSNRLESHHLHHLHNLGQLHIYLSDNNTYPRRNQNDIGSLPDIVATDMHPWEVLLDMHISDLEWGWDPDSASLLMDTVSVLLQLVCLTGMLLVLIRKEAQLEVRSDHRLCR